MFVCAVRVCCIFEVLFVMAALLRLITAKHEIVRCNEAVGSCDDVIKKVSADASKVILGNLCSALECLRLCFLFALLVCNTTAELYICIGF